MLSDILLILILLFGLLGSRVARARQARLSLLSHLLALIHHLRLLPATLPTAQLHSLSVIHYILIVINRNLLFPIIEIYIALASMTAPTGPRIQLR
jgi:hypothetical protein